MHWSDSVWPTFCIEDAARTEAFGEPTFYIAPSALHRMDVKTWKLRYPKLIVDGAQGATLVVNDIFFNVRQQPGIVGFVFGLLGVTGPEPKAPKLALRKVADDKSALRAQLEQWANMENLKRIIVSHGAVIETDSREVLRRIAATID
jgi:hypothetical protein